MAPFAITVQGTQRVAATPVHDQNPPRATNDLTKVRRRIHRLPVLGTGDGSARDHPHEVLTAIPHARPTLMRDLVSSFKPHKLSITTLPNLSVSVMGATKRVAKLIVLDASGGGRPSSRRSGSGTCSPALIAWYQGSSNRSKRAIRSPSPTRRQRS